MPWPRAVARLNKRYTNRFIEPIVGRFPGYAVVGHEGRRSGTPYRTPVYAFAGGNHLVVALTYGVHADWIQNVLAGQGSIRYGGRDLAIIDAKICGRIDAWPYLPLPIRGALRVLRVDDFAFLSTSSTPTSPAR